MGTTQYVTIPIREYALLARLEGQVRGLLNMPVESEYDRSPAVRKAMHDTLNLLDYRRNGEKVSA